jgi:UvrD/REP helicase N-terminal domain
MAWNTNLQGPHLNIAAFTGTPLRVVAGPGTGKTFALMRRVARLLEQGVQPNRILAVTFTRTAAGDLVEKLAGVPGADTVAAKTLHSLSFGLLSRTAVFQALGRNARPLMDFERNTLVCDLKDQFGGKKAVNALIEAFEAYWARLQHHAPGWPTDPKEQAFDHALRNWLIFHRAMLIGELVPLAYDFVHQNPTHPDIPHYSHIVVDEYQDLNRADQALIDALAGQAAVTVVGDEDQSIYGFRYAHPEGIVEYPQTHANTHDELLIECRRPKPSPPLVSSWSEVTITFLSDERVEIRIGKQRETRNSAEFGFEDRRSGKPNRAWYMLRALAEHNGAISEPVVTDKDLKWSQVEKRMEEIRKLFQRHFRLTSSPIIFVPKEEQQPSEYQALFKITCGPSFNT